MTDPGSSAKKLGFLNVFHRRKQLTSHRPLSEALQLPLSDQFAQTPLVSQLIAKELSTPLPLQNRITLVKETAVLLTTRIVTNVELLWVTVQDLLAPQQPAAARSAAFEFLNACIQGQFENLGPLRVVFFDSIKKHNVPEDFEHRISSLRHLTKDGRDISSFEKDIVPLLSEWIGDIFGRYLEERAINETQRTSEPHVQGLRPSLHLLTNVVKFNFAQLEENEIARLVDDVAFVCSQTTNVENLQGCLAFFDVLVRYGSVPDKCLPLYVEALCRTVNYDDTSVESWQIVRILLKSHCSHAAVRILCQILGNAGNRDQSNLDSQEKTADKSMEQLFETATLGKESPLTNHGADGKVLCGKEGEVAGRSEISVSGKVLRGAIFYLGMATWGTQQVEGLTHSFSAALLAMRSVLRLRLSVVNYEILLSISRLIKKYEKDLSVIEWGVILDTVDYLSFYVLESESNPQPCENERTPSRSSNRVIGPAEGSDPVRRRASLCRKVLLADPPPTSSKEKPELLALYGRVIHQLHRVIISLSGSHQVPVSKYICTLYSLKDHLPPDLATTLLDHYLAQHSFHPSNSIWLELLEGVMTTFYLNETQPSSLRLRLITVIQELYEGTRDFYQAEVVKRIFVPMLSNLPMEGDKEIAIRAMELLEVAAMECCGDENDDNFPSLLAILSQCTRCTCINPEKSTEQRNITGSEKENLAHPPPTHNTTNMQTIPPTVYTTPPVSFSSSMPIPTCQSLTAAQHLLFLFRSTLRRRRNARYAPSIFRELLSIASSQNVQLNTRHIVLNGLLSLRADLNHRVYMVEEDPDETTISESTSALGGAPASGKGDVFGTNTRTSTTNVQGPASSVSRHSSNASASRRVAAMSVRSHRPSPFVVTFVYEREQAMLRPSMHSGENERTTTSVEADSGPNENQDGNRPSIPPRALVLLPVGELIETFTRILRFEQDWGIFNKVHFYFPSLLGYKHLFCGATDEIHTLRAFLCEWVSGARVAESVINIPPEMRRADIYASAYAVLTALIGYRRVFNKNELDELVLAFQLGLSKWVQTAKPCIHALAVCCQELPLSVTKLLPSTVVKLAQVMSTPTMSVHILDFLSGLARLPHLYVNFVESDFRRVFGIALQYIQSSQAQQKQQQQQQQAPAASASASAASAIGTTPPTSANQASVNATATHALSQYVLTLAYHVITIWFLSIRLPERKRHVAFIVRGLLHACEVGSNEATVDEQTETCLDMLARHAYATCDGRPEKSLVSELLFPTSTKSASAGGTTRTWVLGSALMTVRTSARSGWAEITVRRASGTVRMLAKLENKRKGEELDFITLPSLLMAHWTEGNPDWSDEVERPEPDDDVETPTPFADGFSNDETGVIPLQVVGNTTGDGKDFSAPDAQVGHSSLVRHLSLSGITLRKCYVRSTGRHGRSSSLEGGVASKPFSVRELREANVKSTTRVRGGSATESERPPSFRNGSIASQSAQSEEGSSRPKWVSETESPPNSVNGADSFRSFSSNTSPVKHARSSGDVSRSRQTSLSNSNTGTGMLGPHGGDSVLSRSAQLVMERVFSSPLHSGTSPATPSKIYRTGDPYLDPAFVFLQLSSGTDMLTREMPVPLPDDEATGRALNVLDRTPVVDFHKIGVVYVAPGQNDETSILANAHGPPSYVRFLNSLGRLVGLQGCTEVYTGGLDTEYDIDGKFAYYWSDDVTQVIFHATTMMPTDLQRDPQCTAKKRHIGNDFVTIVYNDNGSTEYRHDTIPGQFNFVNVLITPLSRDTATGVDASFAVQVQRREDMPELGPASEPKILSAGGVGPFVRQIALHANIFAQVFLQSGGGAGKVEYVSNWKERLRQIKRVKQRALGSNAGGVIGTAVPTSNSTPALSKSGPAPPVSVGGSGGKGTTSGGAFDGLTRNSARPASPLDSRGEEKQNLGVLQWEPVMDFSRWT